jgi:GT2 family glycosyltransferase
VREPVVPADAPPCDVDYVWGCALLARTEALSRIGLFDERYVAYFEDADLCLRARAAGYRIVGVPGARIDHFGGRAGDRRLLQQTYLRGRNWLRCFARHAPPELRLRAVLAVAAYRLPRLALGSALWYIARKLRPRGRRVSL